MIAVENVQGYAQLYIGTSAYDKVPDNAEWGKIPIVNQANQECTDIEFDLQVNFVYVDCVDTSDNVTNFTNYFIVPVNIDDP